jgi:hypothetical protein
MCSVGHDCLVITPGADPLPLSLYLDVIKSALPDVDEAAFLHGMPAANGCVARG